MKDEFNQQEVDYDLIAKYLNGAASVDEVRLVESWTKASEDNAQLFASLSMIWNETEPNHFIDQPNSFKPNSEVAWKKVQKRIQPPVAKSFRLNLWYSVAAVLMFVAGGIFIFFNQLGQPKHISQIAKEANQTIHFAEASSVQIKQGSELIYPVQFTGKTREVTLKGEAFFEISPNPEMPFIVKTDLVDIKVLGTSFNVKAADENAVEVFVETGIVELMNANGNLKLHPGETGTFNATTKQFEKVADQTIVNQFWRNQKLIFKHAKLDDVIVILNDKYQTNIELTGDVIGEREITVKFENQGIEVILDVLVNTLNLKLETLENGSFLLKDAGE